jgi:alkylated DNA nucleotide flippase Atl1
MSNTPNTERVLKLIQAGQPAAPSILQRLLNLTNDQVNRALRQLRDDGRLPPNTSKSSPTSERILALVNEGHSLHRGQLASLIGVTERQIESAIASLRRQGRLPPGRILNRARPTNKADVNITPDDLAWMDAQRQRAAMKAAFRSTARC